MNEFTKEELQKILAWGNLYQSGSELCWPKLGSKKENKEFMRKIQFMVDNYCEHDGEIGKDYPAEKCMKCGDYWE